MRKRTWMRRGWQAAGGLMVVLGLPALANAQQGGLFPNASIRRERVPCAMEDPIYRLYRHEYYGYHPTCWRKFPSGWGCPSPEAPNAAESFRLLPRDKPPELGPEGEDPGGERGDMPAAGGGARGGAARPSELPALPSTERSPFDLDAKPNTPPPAGDTPPAAQPPAGRDELPGLPPAGNDTPPPATPPGESSASVEPGGNRPLLALPDPTVNPSSTASTSRASIFPGDVDLPPMPHARPDAPHAHAHEHAPAQAPRRTSVIGSFLSGRLFRR